MHYLSVGALFKNEGLILKEWIEHHLFHSIEHFYLINDQSTDNSVQVLQEYIDKGIVTLYNSSREYYLGRQRDMYNEFILPNLTKKLTKWLLIIDLDEFMWSPIHIKLATLLKTCEHFGQIQVNHTLFGSNGYIEQPKTVVQSFTKRSKEQSTNSPNGNFKYFVNSSYDFKSLNVHHASFVNKEYETQHSEFVLLGPEYFILNHYCVQSLEFWKKIKCTRGDSDNYLIRSENDFHKFDINDVDDFELVKQNSDMDN